MKRDCTVIVRRRRRGELARLAAAWAFPTLGLCLIAVKLVALISR